ncbi:MAG TPA: HEAT repeat domain-containing protein [Longimicrobiales bacterium]|nr:HEAT repeat domain-containing protein [Longimicrobiales bacterium]
MVTPTDAPASAAPAPPGFLATLWEQHLDEVGFLFGQWRAALADSDHTIGSVGELEERIRAHLEGVRVPGEQAIPPLVEALEGDDPDLAFSAAYALASRGDEPAAELVVGAFEAADPEAIQPLALALAYSPLPQPLLARLRTQLGGEAPGRAIAAAEVLAFHRALELSGAELRYFLEHEDPAVRTRAWRLAGLVGAAVPAKAYAAALQDEDPAVGHAALEAGAWCGEAGVLPALRQIAAAPTPERLPALRLLAALGGPGDVPIMERIAASAALGPERFRVLAAYGHPRLVEPLIAALGDEDPKTAAAAGTAFERLTGVDIASNETATERPPEGAEPDEFEAEFLEEVVVPDPELARQAWRRLEPTLGGAQRLCRGVDLAGRIDAAALETLDMESRRDLYLRARLSGAWKGTAVQLEVFPQRPETREG